MWLSVRAHWPEGLFFRKPIIPKYQMDMVMGINATLNNISAKISWRSVLLVEETGLHREPTDQSQVNENFIQWWSTNVTISTERKMYNISPQIVHTKTVHDMWWKSTSWLGYGDKNVDWLNRLMGYQPPLDSWSPVPIQI
jgi:hypothetical protein